MPEGSIPLRARIWLWRINLAWSKLIDADGISRIYKQPTWYVLDAFSPHDLQHLLRAPLIETGSRVTVVDVGLDVEHDRRQTGFGLTGECGQRDVLVEAKQGPDLHGNMRQDGVTVAVSH